MGNTEPIFRITGSFISNSCRMGTEGQHLRLDITDKSGQSIKCVAFSAPDTWFRFSADDVCDFLIQPTENDFRGTRSVEARLLDIIPLADC